MKNLQEVNKKRKSLQKVLPGLGPANGCWLGEEHPVITICTDLRLPEASEAVKVRLKNQKIKKSNIRVFQLLFDSQKCRGVA